MIAETAKRPPPPGDFVDADGLRLHYECGGAATGTPLLLLHGWLCSTHVWQPGWDRLSQRCHLWAIDLPAHGYSERAPAFSMTLQAQAEVLVAAMRNLALPPLTVVGQSMGGALAMALAAQHPDLVQRLVLVDPVCYSFPLPWSGRLALVPSLGHFLLRYVYRRTMLRHFMRHQVYFDPERMLDEEVALILAHLDVQGTRTLMHRAFRAMHDLKWLGEQIPRIQQPTLLLWGAQDALIPIRIAHRLQGAIANAELRVVDRCGHSMINERPERFCDELLGILPPSSASDAG